MKITRVEDLHLLEGQEVFLKFSDEPAEIKGCIVKITEEMLDSPVPEETTLVVTNPFSERKVEVVTPSKEGYVFISDNEGEDFIDFFDGTEFDEDKMVFGFYVEYVRTEPKAPKTSIYLAGDIMTKGSRLARKEELRELLTLGNYDIYSPVENKSINDKTQMTEEENNTLAERIVKADMDRILGSDKVILEYQPNAIGTITELGILYGMRQSADLLFRAVMDARTKEEFMDSLVELYSKLTPEVSVHSDDLRNTTLPEIGFRRSHSINQFAHGVILDLTNDKGIQEWDEIVEELAFE